jgi:glutaredoxin 2
MLGNEGVIDKLSKEQDTQVLAEVLDFYEYLKHKKEKQWSSIEEDEPNQEELEILKEYKSSQEELVSFTDLIKELNLDGE